MAPFLIVYAGSLTSAVRNTPNSPDKTPRTLLHLRDGRTCHPERGSKVDHEWYAAEFRKALKAAGVTEYVRPFHDLRHASLTNGVVAGEQPLELMARAGHRSMSTTRQYLHLARITFPEKAAALEQHLLAGRKFYPTGMISPDVAGPEPHEHAVSAPG